MNNPFIYGRPVSFKQFIGRKGEIRRILGRILNYGQSTALVGEPKIGKTSLLSYIKTILSDPSQKSLLEQQDLTFICQYIDIPVLERQTTLSIFWEEALRPLEHAVNIPTVLQAYHFAKQEKFDTFVLEQLLSTLRTSNIRVVLLMDEFDLVLNHPLLNSGSFYGGLRSLASRSEALSLIISTRQPLDALNRSTQEISRSGSPFFNFMDEILLGPFTDKDSENLLKQAGSRFKPEEQEWVFLMAGGHPYLIQVAASALWEVYEDGERDMVRRQKMVANILYREAAKVLESTWNLWTPELKLAFTVIALNETPNLFEKRSFDITGMLRKLENYAPELRHLETHGYITPDSKLPTGWKVTTHIFTWWLVDELLHVVRDNIAFEKWISAQEWQGLMTKGEKDNFKHVAVNLTPVSRKSTLY